MRNAALAIVLVACGSFTIACGGGEDQTVAAQQKMVGLWDIHLLNVNPQFRGLEYIHQDGWGNQDTSADGGVTWCRNYFTWTVSDFASDLEYLYTRTMAEDGCGYNAGDKFDNVVMHCYLDPAACPKIQDPAVDPELLATLPTLCQANKGPNDHCNGLEDPNNPTLGWRLCTKTLTDFASDLATCATGKPNSSLPSYTDNSGISNWAPASN